MQNLISNKSYVKKFKSIQQLQQMKWRNQNKNINGKNQTLDSFVNGTKITHNGETTPYANVKSKIKVPASSGLEPTIKPITGPFMYPNYPEFRQYQYTITRKCVTQNTLVVLPTGLGKTHIASVMMVNFHLWFPQGLIFFLAPTKPLVDQQSMSLSNFSHLVPPSCVYSLTGSIQASKRESAYQKKRILFCTPQTLENDLRSNRLDPKKIVLIIFDQAHKAVGNYAYANIARILDKLQFGFRIIGLSATPGSDNQKIQQVIDNLQITNIIAKAQDDPDVKIYIKRKIIQPIYIHSTQIIKEIDQILKQFISWPLNQLLKFKLFDRNLAGGKHGFNPKCFHLINQQVNERLSHLPYKFVYLAQQAKGFLKYMADCQSILKECGYESFKRKFIYQLEQINETDNTIEKLMPQREKLHSNFIKIVKQHSGYKRILDLFKSSVNIGSHPKLEKLRNLLYNFLSQKENIEKKSKVIIFASLRFTCHQINKYLSQPPYGEIIKSEIFLGQAKTTVQTREGENSVTETLKLSQKQQINLIKRYKANELNTLISTSIGEQGLDIGEVDAIFCYEGGMSTIRMVQRMGRTGRKRDGTVYMLLMEGKQTDDYERAIKKNEKMKKLNTKKFRYFSYNPALFEQFSEIPIIFFDKPKNTESHKQVQSQSDEQQASTDGDTDTAETRKQKNTKKKKNSKKDNANDKKKTKKNKNELKQVEKAKEEIKEVSKSQQYDKSQQIEHRNANKCEEMITSFAINMQTIAEMVEKYHQHNKPHQLEHQQSLSSRQIIDSNSQNESQVNKYFRIINKQHIKPDLYSEPSSQPQQYYQQCTQNNTDEKQDSQTENNWQQYSNSNDQFFTSDLEFNQDQISNTELSFVEEEQQKNKGCKQFDRLFDLDLLLQSNNESLQKTIDCEKEKYSSIQYSQSTQVCPQFGSQRSNSFHNKCQSCQQQDHAESLSNSLNHIQIIEDICSPEFKQPPPDHDSLQSDYPQHCISISEEAKKIVMLTKYMQQMKEKDMNYGYILEDIHKEDIKEVPPNNNSSTLIQQNKHEQKSGQPNKQLQQQEQQDDEFSQLLSQYQKIKCSQQQRKESSIAQNKENGNNDGDDALQQLFEQYAIMKQNSNHNNESEKQQQKQN